MCQKARISRYKYLTIWKCSSRVIKRSKIKYAKVQRASEFLAVNSLGLISSVLKIVFLIGYFSNIEQLFNVMRILIVKFDASTWNFLSLLIFPAAFNVSVLGFQHVFLLIFFFFFVVVVVVVFVFVFLSLLLLLLLLLLLIFLPPWLP